MSPKRRPSKKEDHDDPKRRSSKKDHDETKKKAINHPSSKSSARDEEDGRIAHTNQKNEPKKKAIKRSLASKS